MEEKVQRGENVTVRSGFMFRKIWRRRGGM